MAVKPRHSIPDSFGYAFSGLYNFFKTERNGRIHLAAAIATIVAGFVLHIGKQEWVVILLCIAGVISLELINTTLEQLCDEFSPQYNPKIKIIKDMAAGAVLWTSLISVAIACIIFLPKLYASI